MSVVLSCQNCGGENVYYRSVRRNVETKANLKRMSGNIALAFLIIGIVIVFIFGSEASAIPIVSNQTLGILFILIGAAFAFFALKEHESTRITIHKYDCNDCHCKWEINE